MNCPTCKEKLEKIELKEFNFYYCKNNYCYYSIEDIEDCKEHDFSTYARKLCSSNTFQLRKQCIKCGKLDSRTYPQSTVKNFKKLPIVDESKIHFVEKDITELNLFKKKFENEKKIFERNKAHDNFIKEHNKYLKTEKWLEKRKMVLNRDQHICQACLTNIATQVHHKSYRFWKNEPLFDLASVCEPCHLEITKISRETFNFNILFDDIHS
ncbi:HNH endonuclease [Empedobacter brevis]|uniref:HNH endonuclease n=1 Tax=Empedobacter brevis TaxID=247 RepID=UPI00333EA934